jgi:hypothetical protein
VIAGAAMALSSVSVVANALRLRRFAPGRQTSAVVDDRDRLSNTGRRDSARFLDVRQTQETAESDATPTT